MAIPGSDPDITFISKITSAATVAATSFGTWNDDIPATYNPVSSNATKWGSTTLSASGTAGGNVTYWFDATSSWTMAEQNGFISGLALWSAVANITFSLAADAASANFSFIRGSDGSAFQTFPNATPSTVGSGTVGGPGTGAYISIDTSVASFGPIGGSFEEKGGYPYGTLVHELGHMLGLGHAGPYNGDVNASTQQFSAYDTTLWSLMSYISPTDTTAQFYNAYTVTGTNWGANPDGWGYTPTTPMILDILAVQRIYGAPTSGPLASGGQTFGFNCNVSGLAATVFRFHAEFPSGHYHLGRRNQQHARSVRVFGGFDHQSRTRDFLQLQRHGEQYRHRRRHDHQSRGRRRRQRQDFRQRQQRCLARRRRQRLHHRRQQPEYGLRR